MTFRALALPLALAALAVPSGASAAPAPGAISQLPGPAGCLVDESASPGSCATARALLGPGPFMGSNALAFSPDGRNLYVAASRSDAIAIFSSNRRTGELTQASGPAGCVSAEGADGCAAAIGLDGPNSVAVSADGKNVYATSRTTGSLSTFLRNPKSGELVQPPGGCIASVPFPGCSPGRAMSGADIVTVSPDGDNVYVGAFFGNAVASFDRDPTNGELTQPSDATGCLTAAAVDGCATGLALASPEGMAVSADGQSVYVASAASNAVVVLTRDPSTGALAQAADGSGCITQAQLDGCTTGSQLSGANAVAVSADDADVYVSSLLSNSVTSFIRSAPALLAQKPGTSGCMVFLVAVGCSLGHALSAPEGIAVSADGASAYAASFASGAIAVLDRDQSSGALIQRARRAGCVAKAGVAGCREGRRMKGLSSVAVRPDGRYVYSTAFGSNAVGVFRRATSPQPPSGS